LVTGIDQNDRNQIDVGRYLRPGTNTIEITTATPLQNPVTLTAYGQSPVRASGHQHGRRRSN
jgi:hypothetical protein